MTGNDGMVWCGVGFASRGAVHGLRHVRARRLILAACVVALSFALAAAAPGSAQAATSTTQTTVKIGATTFTIKLASNDTAAAFRAYLSKARTLTMKELNGNEKYRYLAKPLPAAPKKFKKVKAGDVMLYGDDCLVVFYKTHKTSYRYTKIGRLTSTKGLAKAAGRKSVKVRFSKMGQVEKPTESVAGADDPTTPSDGADVGVVPDTAPGADVPQNGKDLVLSVNGEPVEVAWETNDSVAALAKLAEDGPLTIRTSRYGGFEQVGAIGASLPRSDVQTTTAPGDIVLYSGNQMVLFYGSNSWSYTRLGKIVGKTDAQLASLLGGDGTVVEISMRGNAAPLRAEDAIVR